MVPFSEQFAGQNVPDKIQLESGLVIQDYVVGDGKEARYDTFVYVHYTGYLMQGSRMFDSRYSCTATSSSS